MWDKLHTLYGDISEDLKQNSWQDFYKFTISDGEPIATQIEKFETICKKLDDAGEKPSDSAVMSRLLDSLPTKFSAFRMAWESTSRSERRKENLIARIVREEKRLITVDEEESSLALKLKTLKQEKWGEKAIASNQTKTKKSK
ncbi:hypothetical protein KPH14_012293 [Odynerus spinipes]|uniref:Uncharacterized protein n=1 Tax=Odynerus spinipes TaxID=1348599 RepID=A0AAD9VKX6_9HYME|nr:hypothetical protein KPH14_012293 [Odynerus spinipes]